MNNCILFRNHKCLDSCIALCKPMTDACRWSSKPWSAWTHRSPSAVRMVSVTVSSYHGKPLTRRRIANALPAAGDSPFSTSIDSELSSSWRRIKYCCSALPAAETVHYTVANDSTCFVFHIVSHYQQWRAEVDRDPQNIGIRGRTIADLSYTKGCERYIIGTLTNKANIIIQYYLVPYRLSTDSKIPDLEFLEWPFCVKFCFAPVRLELWSLAFEVWLLLKL